MADLAVTDDRILVLWAHPRSMSTAFEWMVRMRGDFECLHEPFGPAYYRGEDRRTTRLDENPLEPGRTYASTWEEILAASRQGRVFSKDFPNYVMHLADGDFLDHFRHTFLVRDPAEALPSMYAHWREFTTDEASYEALHRMFDLVVDRDGAVPPVIDAADLAADPAGTVRAWCAAVGIEFVAEALEWEEGDRRDVRWYGGRWHDTLAASTGLGRRPASDKVAVGDVPFLRQMHAQCLPHYEAVAAHRLLPVPA